MTLCYVLHQTDSEFWHIQHSAFSGIFRHIQSHSALLRHIHAHSAPCVTLAYSQHCHILSVGIFRTAGLLKPCETLTRHIQNPPTGPYSAIFKHIQNLRQRFHLQKPGILGILEYSELFHNCIPTHIQNSVIFMKIYEYSEL